MKDKIIQKMTKSRKKKDDSMSIHVLTNRLYKAIQDDNMEEAKFCVENGAFIDIENKTVNAMILAAQLGRKNILNYLIECGAKIDCKDLMGATPLMWASYSDNKEIANILIDNGADVNLPDGEYGATPLIWWTVNSSGEYDRLENLISQGANVSYRDVTGKSAADHAIENSSPEIATILDKLKDKQLHLNKSLVKPFNTIKKFANQLENLSLDCEELQNELKSSYLDFKDKLSLGAIIDSSMLDVLEYCANYYNDESMRELCEKQREYKDMRCRAKKMQRRIKNNSVKEY